MPEPIRVMALVDTVDVLAGAQRLCVQVASKLDTERFESHVCAYMDPPGGRLGEAGREQLAEAGAAFLPLGRQGRYDLKVWPRFMRELRRRRIDVLHSHMIGSNVYAAALGHLAGCPVVICHEHTWSYEGQPTRRFLDRELIGRRADAFVAVSKEDARRMVEIERVRRDVIVTIPNGAPPSEVGDGTRIRRELGIADDAPIIGALGHLRPQKAYWVLLRAAVLLREQHPGLRVLIAGIDLDPSVALLVEELGLGDVVTLLGYREDTADLAAAFDVGVLSSDFEGMPLALLELMESSKPIVATDVGGVSEVVEDGVNGLLVARRDPEAFAGAVSRLIDDPELRVRMGQAGKERRRLFDLDRTVERIEELYEELVARKGRRTVR